MFPGNISLYRSTPETAGSYRHEVGKVSYREAMTNPAAMQFDECAGIYYIVEDLAATAWHEDVIFDISFRRYRTRPEAPEGCGPRRYAWEAGYPGGCRRANDRAGLAVARGPVMDTNEVANQDSGGVCPLSKRIENSPATDPRR